jgi:hypothetical protein
MCALDTGEFVQSKIYTSFEKTMIAEQKRNIKRKQKLYDEKVAKIPADTTTNDDLIHASICSPEWLYSMQSNTLGIYI